MSDDGSNRAMKMGIHASGHIVITGILPYVLLEASAFLSSVMKQPKQIAPLLVSEFLRERRRELSDALAMLLICLNMPFSIII